MKKTTNPREKFRRLFKKAFYEIDRIKQKIHKKDGWIFTTHTHSKNELLDSFHHRRIHSITEKIGDDAKHWYTQGALDNDGQEAYQHYREKVSDGLHELDIQIKDREPTWWEACRGEIKEFIVSIMNNLPALQRTLLGLTEALKCLPGPIGKLALLVNSAAKKLPKLELK